MPSGLDRNLVHQVLSNDSKKTNETWNIFISSATATDSTILLKSVIARLVGSYLYHFNYLISYFNLVKCLINDQIKMFDD